MKDTECNHIFSACFPAYDTGGFCRIKSIGFDSDYSHSIAEVFNFCPICGKNITNDDLITYDNVDLRLKYGVIK